MRKLYLSVIIAAISAAGCASGPIGQAPLLHSPETAATVTVYRRPSVLGATLSMFFIVDGQEIYALRMGQSFRFRLDPGIYPVGYNLGFNRCHGQFSVKPNRQYRVTLTPVCLIDIVEDYGTGAVERTQQSL
jgi:hypothetical protein